MNLLIEKIFIAFSSSYRLVGLCRLVAVYACFFVFSPGLSANDESRPIHEFDFSPHVEGAIEQVWKANLLVEAIVQIESNGNPFSVGRAGERGLMQIKKDTWHEVTAWMFGRTVSFDQAFAPNLNKRVGRAYLADLQIFLHSHRASWADTERSLLLACYNAGPNRVLEAGFNLKKLPEANRDYVQRASDLHDYYIANQQDADTQPMLLSQNTSVHTKLAP